MQDVYAEDLVHRSPGDVSTLTPIETAFEQLARSWVAAEADTDKPSEDGGGSGGGSFTRIMVGQVKQSVLRQIADDAGMQQVCRDLSHLYHYYLHGPKGNRGSASGGGGGGSSSPARDGSQPEIVIRCISGSRTAWTVNLADITDDVESQYLQVSSEAGLYAARCSHLLPHADLILLLSPQSRGKLCMCAPCLCSLGQISDIDVHDTGCEVRTEEHAAHLAGAVS